MTTTEMTRNHHALNHFVASNPGALKTSLSGEYSTLRAALAMTRFQGTLYTIRDIEKVDLWTIITSRTVLLFLFFLGLIILLLTLMQSHLFFPSRSNLSLSNHHEAFATDGSGTSMTRSAIIGQGLLCGIPFASTRITVGPVLEIRHALYARMTSVFASAFFFPMIARLSNMCIFALPCVFECIGTSVFSLFRHLCGSRKECNMSEHWIHEEMFFIPA